MVFEVSHHREEISITADENGRIVIGHLGNHIHCDAGIYSLFSYLTSEILYRPIFALFDPIGLQRMYLILAYVLELKEICTSLDTRPYPIRLRLQRDPLGSTYFNRPSRSLPYFSSVGGEILF